MWGIIIQKKNFSSENIFKPKPDILLIDLPDEVFKKLKSEGFNVTNGSFGSPYNVQRSYCFSQVVGEESLPLISEQDIVIIDLEGTDVLKEPEGESEIYDDDIKDYYCCQEAGWIDPRPKNMQKYKNKFDRILRFGGFYIIIAEPRYSLDFYYATLNDYGTPMGEQLDIDNWSFLSILDSIYIESDEGREIYHVSDILKDYISETKYNSVFSPNVNIKDDFHCLIKNKFDKCVSCLITSEDSKLKGNILILPSMSITPTLIINLLNEVLPMLSPHLFPNIEGKWVERPEYELEPITRYKIQIEEILHNANNEVSLINKQIENEKNKFEFIHGIITSTGDDLVEYIEEYLSYISFDYVENVDKLNENNFKQEDLRINDNSVKLLVEIKGPSTLTKDNDIMQLVKYITRRRKEWKTFDVNGVLIINHQKNIPPLERNNNSVFTELQIKDAIEQDIGLITTWDLFLLIKGMMQYKWDPEVIRELFYETGKISNIPTHYKFIGKICAYIKKDNILGIDITSGNLAIGEKIGYITSNGFLEENIESLQLENKNVEDVMKGHKVGIKTKFNESQFTIGLNVYKVLDINEKN